MTHKRAGKSVQHSSPQSRKAPSTAISPARIAAFEILSLVLEGKGHSDELLHSARTADLSPEDRKLVTALVMGTLRWQLALDARIQPLLARPGQILPTPVAVALRLGAFQLLFMDRIPAHAALNESVELTRAANQPQAAGMVNAILRRLQREAHPGLTPEAAHPAWLLERWSAQYGPECTHAICAYDQQEPTPGDLFRGSEADTEDATLQLPQIDDGSRLIAELAAVAGPAAARVWDACAAPGGKTLILARRLPQAEILATDISPRRLAHTAARLRRYPYAGHVRTRLHDASTPMEHQAFDLIVCDLPCSGTGTLARNPEIRLNLRPEDLRRQAERQRAILTSALAQLAPGGRLVYSTCSLEPEENERVLESAALRHRLRRIPVEPFLTRLVDSQILRPESARDLGESAVRELNLRTLPGTNPCDGFFAAVLERA